MFLFGVYIYVDSIRRAITIFKDAGGICKEDKNMYIIMPIINVISSVILVNMIALPGIILGTIFSYLFLIIFSYPKYVFKPLFGKDVKNYYMDFLKYIIIAVISLLLSIFILNYISFSNNIVNIIVDLIVSFLVGTTIFVLFIRKTNEFKELFILAKNIIMKINLFKGNIREDNNS